MCVPRFPFTLFSVLAEIQVNLPSGGYIFEDPDPGLVRTASVL